MRNRIGKIKSIPSPKLPVVGVLPFKMPNWFMKPPVIEVEKGLPCKEPALHMHHSRWARVEVEVDISFAPALNSDVA